MGKTSRNQACDFKALPTIDRWLMGIYLAGKGTLEINPLLLKRQFRLGKVLIQRLRTMVGGYRSIQNQVCEHCQPLVTEELPRCCLFEGNPHGTVSLAFTKDGTVLYEFFLWSRPRAWGMDSVGWQEGKKGGKGGRGMLSSPCLPEAQDLGLGLSRPEGTLGEQGWSPLTLSSRLPFSLWTDWHRLWVLLPSQK